MTAMLKRKVKASAGILCPSTTAAGSFRSGTLTTLSAGSMAFRKCPKINFDGKIGVR